jgi:hypothetical protein
MTLLRLALLFAIGVATGRVPWLVPETSKLARRRP